MADTGWKLGTVAFNDGVGGASQTWINKDTILAIASPPTATPRTYASVSIYAEVTQWIGARGFDFSAIPSGATITGVAARITVNTPPADPIGSKLCDLFLRKDATTSVGTDQSGDISVAGGWTTYTLGGDGNLWGTSLSDSEVKNSLFSIAMRFINPDDYGTAAVESLEAKVFYASGGANSPATTHVTRRRR